MQTATRKKQQARSSKSNRKARSQAWLTAGEANMNAKVTRVEHKAMNRGTAVHLGKARVKYVWACGCTKVETMKDQRGHELFEATVGVLVSNWRTNGVTLLQCTKHPDHHEEFSPLPRLNFMYPQPPLDDLRIDEVEYQHRFHEAELSTTEMCAILKNAQDSVPESVREVVMLNMLLVAEHLLKQANLRVRLDDSELLLKQRLLRALKNVCGATSYLTARVTHAPVPGDRA